MTTLITGCSRGIGRALVVEALRKDHEVIAVTRNVSAFDRMKSEFSGQLQLIEGDIGTQEGRRHVVKEVRQLSRLDTLINNAGVKPRDDEDGFIESFQVNAIAPFVLCRDLIPILKKSNEPRVVQISTVMSSFQDCTSGGRYSAKGFYAYRSSKAALNMLTKTLALDFPEIRFAIVHPGWVQTEMGGKSAPVSPEQSAIGIWKLIDQMNLNNSGTFKDFNGAEVPW